MRRPRPEKPPPNGRRAGCQRDAPDRGRPGFPSAAGFIAPCLPTKTDKLPSGSQRLHEIKHDGLRTTMSFYAERFLPLLIDLSMRNKRLHPYRERTAGAAEGRVLDIGIGSGLNLPFYAQKAAEIFGLDPSLPLLARAQSKASRRQTPVHLIEGSAERIPLADRSMDPIVMTWTGCSIPEIFAALEEMRRVLKPCGRLLFVEHGRAPEPRVARWQDRLNPLWQRFSGGCRLNRKIDDLLSDAGFQIDRLTTGYIPGPKIMTFFYVNPSGVTPASRILHINVLERLHPLGIRFHEIGDRLLG